MEQAAQASLILGLISVAACALVAPFAIWKGNEATRLAQRARLPVPQNAKAGLIMGWIMSVVMGCVLLFMLTIMMVAIAS